MTCSTRSVYRVVPGSRALQPMECLVTIMSTHSLVSMDTLLMSSVVKIHPHVHTSYQPDSIAVSAANVTSLSSLRAGQKNQVPSFLFHIINVGHRPRFLCSLSQIHVLTTLLPWSCIHRSIRYVRCCRSNRAPVVLLLCLWLTNASDNQLYQSQGLITVQQPTS